MRVLFAGSPAIAVPALEVFFSPDAPPEIELAGVLTNPDTPKGRHGQREATDVGVAADTLSARLVAAGKPPIVQLKPEKLGAAARAEVAAIRPDLLVSFAYGHIFGPKFLALFPRGGINIHPSLLPKYRGASPIQAAILNRDAETGLSIQTLALEMDSGDILHQEPVPLHGRESAETLAAEMAARAARALPLVLRGVAAGNIARRPQEGAASFCSVITKDDGRINWTDGADVIDARIRAFTPWPLSWTAHGEQRLFILEAEPYSGDKSGGDGTNGGTIGEAGTVLGIDKKAGILVQTGRGVLAVRRLQYWTRKALEWRAFLNGARDFLNTRLV
jgi:methionyl-tRNA formyltransferase